MQKLILFILASLARLILRIHAPKVIGITGTVGKTTITGHVTTLMRAHFGARAIGASAYHYNGEYGLPLTIIGAKTGGKNPFLWIWVFLIAISRMLRPYPEYLVLEYGIDHPGEMDFLLSIVRPDIAIITRIAPNHLEQFGSLELYREEKLKIAKDPRTLLVLHDSLRDFIKREDIVFYGEKETSTVRVEKTLQRIDGLEMDISYEDDSHHLLLRAFGAYQAENILPLFPLAKKIEIPLTTIETLAPKFLPEAGRSRILEGISSTTIIDGSYNGGYEAIIEGLRSLIPFLLTHRIIVFLGDMRELGEHAEILHRQVGQFLVDYFTQDAAHVRVFLVGPLSGTYVYPLLEGKISVERSLSSREMGKSIREYIMREMRPTIVYVKGSQNTIFLEEGIKEFLRDPLLAKDLVRQSPSWEKKKETFFSLLSREK